MVDYPYVFIILLKLFLLNWFHLSFWTTKGEINFAEGVKFYLKSDHIVVEGIV